MVPTELPKTTTAETLTVGSYLISPIPTPNTTIMPTILVAGSSAVEGRDALSSTKVEGLDSHPSLEPTDPVQIITEVFGADAPMALAIAKAESNLDCSAYSYTNDAGVMQVNLDWHLEKFAGADPYDCLANVKVAKQIFDASGWSAWATYTNGRVWRFL